MVFKQEQVLNPEELYDEIPPDSSAMIESMRAHGYTLATAVADLIDNSISAECREIHLQFEWEEENSWIAISDDGIGMDEAGLVAAMRLGSRSPLLERDQADLGRFGLGLKTASFSQARRLTVVTRQAEGTDSLRRWDLDHLAKPEVSGWQLLRTAHPESGDRIRKLREGAGASGTLVLLENMDRVHGIQSGSTSQSGSDTRFFIQEASKVKEHLEMVFHRFLSDRSSGGVRIFLNGEALEPWDPFLEKHPATQIFSPENFPADEVTKAFGSVSLKGFVLPHRDRFDEQDQENSHRVHRKAGGPEGWNAQQGFYLYRNRRLILAGDWLGLGPGRNGWKKEEHYKLARIRVDIPNSTDEEWQIDVKKSTALAPPALKDWMQGLADTVRKRAKQVYSHRGSYGPRKGRSKAEQEHPWINRTRKGETFSYRINRKNPVLKALLDSLPQDDENRLETLLRLIEETVPVERIWIDTAENQEGLAKPFQGESTARLKKHIRSVHDALIAQGENPEEAWSRIRAFPAFQGSDAEALIALLMEESRS